MTAPAAAEPPQPSADGVGVYHPRRPRASPPMQYLTEWRLQLAAEQLATGSRKVAAVGADVGYESEAAFSRAFKRSTGYAPAAWRRMRQGREEAGGRAAQVPPASHQPK
jgi:AraC-like DNA-binding protein